MVVIFAALLGAATGALVARRRKGDGADMAQWGFAFAVLFALAGLFLTIAIHRLSV